VNSRNKGERNQKLKLKKKKKKTAPTPVFYHPTSLFPFSILLLIYHVLDHYNFNTTVTNPFPTSTEAPPYSDKDGSSLLSASTFISGSNSSNKLVTPCTTRRTTNQQHP